MVYMVEGETMQLEYNNYVSLYVCRPRICNMQNDIKLLQLLPGVYLLHAIYNTLVISGIV